MDESQNNNYAQREMPVTKKILYMWLRLYKFLENTKLTYRKMSDLLVISVNFVQ